MCVKLTAELGNCKMTMQELLNLNLGQWCNWTNPPTPMWMCT